MECLLVCLSLVYLLFVSLRQASPGLVGPQVNVGLFLHGTAVQSTVVSCVFLRNSVFVLYTALWSERVAMSGVWTTEFRCRITIIKSRNSWDGNIPIMYLKIPAISALTLTPTGQKVKPKIVFRYVDRWRICHDFYFTVCLKGKVWQYSTA